MRIYEPNKLIKTVFIVGSTSPTFIVGSTSPEYVIVDKYFCRESFYFTNQK